MKSVIRAVLHEPLIGIDHEDAFAGGGIFFVEDQDAGGNARTVKEIGRHAPSIDPL